MPCGVLQHLNCIYVHKTFRMLSLNASSKSSQRFIVRFCVIKIQAIKFWDNPRKFPMYYR